MAFAMLFLMSLKTPSQRRRCQAQKPPPTGVGSIWPFLWYSWDGCTAASLNPNAVSVVDDGERLFRVPKDGIAGHTTFNMHACDLQDVTAWMLLRRSITSLIPVGMGKQTEKRRKDKKSPNVTKRYSSIAGGGEV